MNILVSILALACAVGSAANFVAMARLSGRVERLERTQPGMALNEEQLAMILKDAIARWAEEREVEEQA